MSDRHAYFLSSSFPSNERAIERRVSGNWHVRCGHCGVVLAGHRGWPGDSTEIVWRHDGRSWFGSFEVLQ
mgnify:CR=1 FL=1